MAKDVKREISEEDDKTIIYMIVGFCVGVIISLIFFEYYWLGVGGGAGMLVGILISTLVDYLGAQDKETRKKEVKPATKKETIKKKTPIAKKAATSKKSSVKKTTKK